MLGAALVPSLAGLLAERMGLEFVSSSPCCSQYSCLRRTNYFSTSPATVCYVDRWRASADCEAAATQARA